MLHPRAILPLDVETAAVAGVAGGGAVLLDLNDDGVGVAVGEDLDDVLGIPRLLPLHPVLVAGAAEEPGLAVADGVFEGLLIHEGDHQHFAALHILNHGRNQAAHLGKIDFDHVFILP